MGTDIHLCVEVRRGGRWERADPPPAARDPWLVEQAEEEGAGGDGWYRTRAAKVWYDDRNYDLFGMLANVRNGRGFAGCDTGDGFVPISNPRGLPADLSDGVRRLLEDRAEDDNDVWLGDHSHSWLTLRELTKYDWDQVTLRRGWVDPWNFELWRKEKRPASWSGGVSGGRVEHVSNQQMARMIDGGDLRWEGPAPEPGTWEDRPYSTALQRDMKGWGLEAGTVGARMAAADGTARHYTLVEWPVSYREAAGTFYARTLPALKELGPPDDVRIVFGFDS